MRINTLNTDFYLLHKRQKYLLLTIFLFLFLFCVFQSQDLNKDRGNYISLLSVIRQNEFLYSFFVFEPFFAFLASLLSNFNDELYHKSFFAITAFSSLLIKFNLAKKFKCNYLIFFILFFSYFYFVHEVTQIRAGLAIGFFYISIYYYVSKKYNLFLLFGIIASCCHYSCAIFIFVPLLVSYSPNYLFYSKYVLLFSLLPFFIFSDGMIFNFIESVSSTLNFKKVDMNLALLKTLNFDKKAVLIRLLPQLPLLMLSVFYFQYIKKDKYLFALFQLYLLFFISVVYLSELYVVAFRISDIFLVSYIFLFSRIYFLIKQRYLYSFFIICFSSVILINALKNVFI